MTEIRQTEPPAAAPRRADTLKEEFASLAFDCVARQQAAGINAFALGKFLTGTYAVFVQTLQAGKNRIPLVTPKPVRPIPGAEKDFNAFGRAINRMLLGSPSSFSCLSAWKAGSDISIHMERPHMFTVKDMASRAARELPVMVESLIHEIERGAHPGIKTITIDSPLFIKRKNGRPEVRLAAHKLKESFGANAEIIPPHYLNRVIWGIPVPLRELGVYGWKTVGKLAQGISHVLENQEGADLLRPLKAASNFARNFERDNYTGGVRLNVATPEARINTLSHCQTLSENKSGAPAVDVRAKNHGTSAESSGAVNLYQSMAVLPVGKSFMFLTADGSPHVVKRTADNRYEIFNGLERAPGGTTVNGREINGHVRLQPGDSIKVGASTFNFLANREARSSPLEERRWAEIRRLPIGGVYAIGSEIKRGMVLQDPKVAPLHCYVQRTGPEEYHLVTAASSRHSLEVWNGKNWSGVPGGKKVNLVSGQMLRVAGAELTLPHPELSYRQRHNGVLWAMAETPLALSERVKANSPQITMGGLTVYGLSSGQAAKLKQLLQREPLDLQIGTLYFSDKIGKVMDPSGKVSAINAIPAPNGMIVSKAILNDEAGACRLLAELNQLQKRNTTLAALSGQQERFFSRRWEEALAWQAHHDARNFIPQGSWKIDRQSPIGGGSIIRTAGNVARQLIVIHLDEKDPVLVAAYDSFRRRNAEAIARLSNDPAMSPETRQKHLLALAATEVNRLLAYDSEKRTCVRNGRTVTEDMVGANEERIYQRFAAQQKSNVVVVSFGDYLKDGKGVCEHKALLAGYFAENMRRDKLLSPSTIISHERNWTRVPPGWGEDLRGGHAWAGVSLANGERLAVDPTQNYVGPPSPRHCDPRLDVRWLYLNEDEIEAALEMPIGAAK